MFKITKMFLFYNGYKQDFKQEEKRRDLSPSRTAKLVGITLDVHNEGPDSDQDLKVSVPHPRRVS